MPAVAAASERQTEPAAPPPIRIEIDPAISAGFIHDRYDLLIRGRVVSGVPVEEVAVRLDDVVIGRVQYGQSDQVAEASRADDDGGIQHVFHINVPLRRAQAHGMCTCIIAARTHDGDTHEESFDFAVDPSNADAGLRCLRADAFVLCIRASAAVGRALCRAGGAGRQWTVAGARLGGVAHSRGDGAGVHR